MGAERAGFVEERHGAHRLRLPPAPAGNGQRPLFGTTTPEPQQSSEATSEEADMSGRRNPPQSLEALAGKRLTPRMLSVVAAAAAEAERRGHTYIGTEHTLLGLLSEPDGIAGRVLESLGASAPAAAERTRSWTATDTADEPRRQARRNKPPGSPAGPRKSNARTTQQRRVQLPITKGRFHASVETIQKAHLVA